MPYILKEDRPQYELSVADVSEKLALIPPRERVGHCTYIFYSILKRVFTGRFFAFCCAVGVLGCTLLEFYRRVVAPYEDKKREENGDV